MNITLSKELEHITEIKEFVQDETYFNTHSKYFSVDNIKIYLTDWVKVENGVRTTFKDLSMSYDIIPNIFNISNHFSEIQQVIGFKSCGKDIIELIDDFHTVLERDKDKLEERMDNKEMFLQEIHNKHKDKV